MTITNEKAIITFFHCGLCMGEMPAGVSPREWSQIEVGFTKQGLQVWCKRHECNIMNMDFEGHTHPANLSRNPKNNQ